MIFAETLAHLSSTKLPSTSKSGMIEVRSLLHGDGRDNALQMMTFCIKIASSGVIGTSIIEVRSCRGIVVDELW